MQWYRARSFQAFSSRSTVNRVGADRRAVRVLSLALSRHCSLLLPHNWSRSSGRHYVDLDASPAPGEAGLAADHPGTDRPSVRMRELCNLCQNFFVGTVVFGLLPASHFVVDALGK